MTLPTSGCSSSPNTITAARRLSHSAPEQKAAQRQLDPGTAPELAGGPPLPLSPVLQATQAFALAGQYQRLDLKLTPRTQVGKFNDSAIQPPGPTALDAGKFNTVYSVTYRWADGTKMDTVFKPLKNSGIVRAADVGISAAQPRIANRNLATCAVAGLLGFKVVPEIHMGICNNELGLVMGRAQGLPARKNLKAFKSVNVIREVTKLQLLDHLTAQVDRHSRNYFVHSAENGAAVVTGVDLDNSFSPRLKSPNNIARIATHPIQSSFRGTLMPQVVDREMADAILSLPGEMLKSTLAEFLSDDEVAATLVRHQKMIAHLESLQVQGRIVDPTDWGKPWVQALLTPESSYAARERAGVLSWSGSAGALQGTPAPEARQSLVPPFEKKEPPPGDAPQGNS